MKFDIPQNLDPGLWPPEEYEPILSEFGRIIHNWNNIERLLRQLVFNLSDGGDKAHIITAHMGTQGLVDALRTIANTYFQDPQKDALLHAMNIFEDLRVYRNYLVHSFDTLKSSFVGKQVFAGMTQYQARGEFFIKEIDLTYDDIKEISRLIRAGEYYFTLIHNHIVPFNHGKVPPERIKPLPDKLPRPDKLPTTLRRPNIGKPQPQS